MARRVDGFDAWQAEVPDKLGLNKGCEETSAGSIDVDGNVESGLCKKPIERDADLVHRLVLEGERDAERDDDADGILIAPLYDFFRGEQQAVAVHGHFADFHIEV